MARVLGAGILWVWWGAGLRRRHLSKGLILRSLLQREGDDAASFGQEFVPAAGREVGAKIPTKQPQD